ncbi:MAG TPA: formate dehydrogenase accessory protein FdhE [Bryobacteraceae bacterium]|nr:formate dehydrogenase accessory protein FdhE [Bryobacteraceae bacterium]
MCPQCKEESETRLPVYTADQFPHVRVEACDSCQTYIKSVDLTRNGLAVPVVDELATVSLNVWAEQRGYAKLQLNLLGM